MQAHYVLQARRGAVGVAPDLERGVTGIAAGRRETIGEAGVGWRRRTESRSMISGMIRFCLCTTFSLSSGRSARFQTACSQAYYTVFRDSKRPSERHNRRALASRLDCQCSERPRVPRAGPRQDQEVWSPILIVVPLTPGRANPARGRTPRGVAREHRESKPAVKQEPSSSEKELKTKPSARRQKLADYASVPVYNILDFAS